MALLDLLKRTKAKLFIFFFLKEGKKKKKEGPGVQDQLKQYQTHPT